MELIEALQTDNNLAYSQPDSLTLFV